MSAQHTPTPFTHVARPAVIADDFPEQRYFGTQDDAIFGTRGDGEQYAAADVYRSSREDFARLGVQLGRGVQSQAMVGMHLDANGLRDLARRLLDAAHDIESNPAHVLRMAATTKPVDKRDDDNTPLVSEPVIEAVRGSA